MNSLFSGMAGRVWLAFVLSFAGRAFALDGSDWAVQITATFSSDPQGLRLSWHSDPYATGYSVFRKMRDELSWTLLQQIDGSSDSFIDRNVAKGQAYEYKIEKVSTGGRDNWSYTGYGYVYAGTELPLVGFRGRAIILSEQSVTSALQASLDRLEYDLIADGWITVRGVVNATDPVPQVKQTIRELYLQDPVNTKALFLIGHIPVPYSGDIAPDEHPAHQGAWPADVYYGDMYGTWTDSTVNDVQAERDANKNVPGDGKFDQSNISSVQLAVGRVDLSNLTCFANKTPSYGELDLLLRYLDKDHAFRAGLVQLPQKGLFYNDLQETSPEPMQAMSWRTFPPFVGSNVDVAGEYDWFYMTQTNSYLWSSVTACGDYLISCGLGSSDWWAWSTGVNAVFTTFVGSYFGDWNNESNFLRGSLGAKGTILTTCYDGKPQWLFHHMALGETIGYSTLLTQLNGMNGPYLPHVIGTGQVHIGLLGDPTLRAHPLMMVQALNGTRSGDTVELTWAPPAAVSGLQGYLVLKAADRKGPYEALTPNPIQSPSYAAKGAKATDFFMVKAVALTETPSGSYFNASQGAYYPDPLTTPAIVPLTAVPQAVQATPGQAVPITLTGTGPKGSPLNFLVATQPSKGVLTGIAPNLTYTPFADARGSDSFTFAVNDGVTQTLPVTVTIQILTQNRAPVAVDLSYDVSVGSSIPVVLAASDPDGDAITFQLVGAAQLGQLSGNVPNLVYTAGTITGTETFTYAASDGRLQSALATVTIQVHGNNHPPKANDLVLNAVEDNAASVTLQATDPDGDPITYSVVTAPTHGTLQGLPPNLVYLPRPNYNGGDSFSFTASDGKSTSNIGTVTVSVAPQNDPPTATDLAISGPENLPISFRLAAADIDGDLLSFTVLSPPARGDLSGTPPNLIYTPRPNATGPDSFTYKVSDGQSQSLPATVSIRIIGGNHAPVAQSLTIHALAGENVAIKLSASDPDGDAVIYRVLTSPINGSLSGVPPNLSYTPYPSASPSDTFTFSASDGRLDSAPADVIIVFETPNAPPSALDSSIETIQNQPVAFALTGTDANGDALTFRVIAGPASGSISGAPPNLVYLPVSGFIGRDSLTFVANDGQSDSAPATISIQVKGNSTSGRISAIGLDGDGEILLRIAGNPSQEFRLETSGNASDWTLMVAGTTDQQGEAEFRDPNVTEHCKFYRIVSP